jgi:hypothetical protein
MQIEMSDPNDQHGRKIPIIHHQGSMMWIVDNKKTAKAVTVQLYSCGMLKLLVNDDDVKLWYLLLPTSKCQQQPCVPAEQESLHIQITNTLLLLQHDSNNSNSIITNKLHSTTLQNLEFRVDSQSQGCNDWVAVLQNAIQQVIQCATLEQELRREWEHPS